MGEQLAGRVCAISTSSFIMCGTVWILIPSQRETLLRKGGSFPLAEDSVKKKMVPNPSTHNALGELQLAVLLSPGYHIP